MPSDASSGIPARWKVATDPTDAPSGHPSRRELIDRYRARAWVLHVHYQWESGVGGVSLGDVLVDVVATRRVADRRLPRIRRLVRALDEHRPEVDRALEEALENWRLERLSSLDRGILRIGAVEILFMDDIPPLATIREAVRLAEAYGGHESPRFVNGVLDALYKSGEDGPARG
jgi:N utilization substance protein B